ncbi:acid-sensing ion channel 5 [Musca vetustissima]|uniref:acid-sensing ion channel 5 n=1 Tax=Musca vetustissima TaxID=27455 RepID=UPI002AB722E7|nr:acid-sensing ion channel 5 [Musca vetustissima]
MAEETGILAFKLMINRNLHILERIFWLLTFIGSIYGALWITNLQIYRFLKSPTVISVDRNYRDWIGYMPAITLCYYDHIDSYKANEFILENWNVSIVDEDYFYYMDFLYAVVNASASNYMDLAKFAKFVDLYALIQAIDRPFEQIINTYEGNFEVPVKSVMTERGSCYVINSSMGEVVKTDSLTFDDLKQPPKCHFGKQQCFIKVDLLESTGTVDVHSPFEISSTDASNIPLHKSDEIIASYKVLETVASANLRDLTRDQRKCVFHDEETSDLKIYSKTVCLAKCRATMAVEMCNCVPFFYTFLEGPSCNPAGFECLLDFKWPVWALHICKCPSTCIEMEYTLHTTKKSSWGGSTLDETKTDVVTSSFRWDLIPPKVRMRRDVVFSFEDLLVSFGGTMALFLGISFITVIGFIYSLVRHLSWDFYHLMKWIYATCFRYRRNFQNRRQLQVLQQRHLVAVIPKRMSLVDSIKKRRELLLKLRCKDSDGALAVENLEDDANVESNPGSLYEFLN